MDMDGLGTRYPGLLEFPQNHGIHAVFFHQESVVELEKTGGF